MREAVAEAIQRAEQLEDPAALVWASLLATMGVTGGDFADGLPYSSRAVAIARERGLLSMLPMALWAQANALFGLGRFNLARSAAEEGIRLASDSDTAGRQLEPHRDRLARIGAGGESAARGHIDEAVQLAAIGGGTMIVAHNEWMLGLLDLTLGRPDEATERLLLLTAIERPEFNLLVGLWSIPDLIEAAARSGRLDETAERFDRYRSW